MSWFSRRVRSPVIPATAGIQILKNQGPRYRFAHPCALAKFAHPVQHRFAHPCALAKFAHPVQHRGDDGSGRRGIRIIVVALCALATVSCGFHLRGTGGAMLPASLASVRVVMGGGANEPLAVAVREAISQAGAQIVVSGDVPTLTILSEQMHSQVASIRTSTGKASEYVLRYTVNFRLDGPPSLPEQTIRLQRDYSFNPEQVLAKEQEERELLRKMRRDAAQQIVRRLARSVGASAR